MGSRKIARQTSTWAPEGSTGRRRVRGHVRAAAARGFFLATSLLFVAMIGVLTVASMH